MRLIKQTKHFLVGVVEVYKNLLVCVTKNLGVSWRPSWKMAENVRF
jgi:hypothetical protein